MDIETYRMESAKLEKLEEISTKLDSILTALGQISVSTGEMNSKIILPGAAQGRGAK